MTDEKHLKETLVTLTSLRELQLHGNELPKLNEATFAQNCNLEVISLGKTKMRVLSNLFTRSPLKQHLIHAKVNFFK